MCLAVPGKIIARDGDEAVVDLQGNRLKVSTVLTPHAVVGSWVLIHAGFALTQLDEHEARQTWDYLRQALGDVPSDDDLGVTGLEPQEAGP
jgi:hydrogenase expression/formation protein HypC